jgi:hypothetical protein
MKLTKQHREAFLNELEQAKNEINDRELIISQRESNDYKGWDEIKKFILNSKIELIQKSLINNEIDF